MSEKGPKYPLMTSRISAVVNAPNWSNNHKIKRLFRPSPPSLSFQPDGTIDYTKQEKDFKRYTTRLRRYLKIFFPTFRSSVEKDRFDRKTFDTHLTIMKLYFEELYKFSGFRDLLDGKPIEFLYMLVDLHDFARYIMNGEYPLEYTERVSDGVEKWLIAEMYGKEAVTEILPYFHTFRWNTGEEAPPDLETATNAQKVALILKTIDTVSKGSDGELVNPEVMFKEGGPYDKWGKKQLEMNRFPLNKFRRDKEGYLLRGKVDFNEYKKSDTRLTQEGLRFTEEITGVPFSAIYEEVKAQTQNLHLFNH